MMQSTKGIPDKQTAVVQDALGQPTVVHDLPVPALRPGYVLVKTMAVALNPSDHKMGKAFPCPGSVVGGDFAGRVVATPPPHNSGTAAALRIGDVVCGISHGSNPGDPASGAFGQYILAQAELLLRVPEGLEVHRAAALGTSLFTACAALWGSLRLEASLENPLPEPGPGGEATPVLVYGGSTSSGTMAVQLLKLSGFTPIATCSPKNFDMVKSFGAENLVDYTSSPEAGKKIKEYTHGRLRYARDCITDQASAACCYAALGRPGGCYASLETCEPGWRTREVVQYKFVMALETLGKEVQLPGEYGRPANSELHQKAQDLAGIFQRLLDSQKLRPHPVRVIGRGFDDVLKGLAMLKSGLVSGKKLVVEIDEDNF